MRCVFRRSPTGLRPRPFIRIRSHRDHAVRRSSCVEPGVLSGTLGFCGAGTAGYSTVPSSRFVLSGVHSSAPVLSPPCSAADAARSLTPCSTRHPTALQLHPVPAWCRCGTGEPGPGADVAGVSPVPVQTWQGRASLRTALSTLPIVAVLLAAGEAVRGRGQAGWVGHGPLRV